MINPALEALLTANRALEAAVAHTGAHVFRLVLPLAMSPAMNVYSGMKGWQRGKLRTAIDHEVAAAKARSKLWSMGVQRAPAPGPMRKIKEHGRTILVPTIRTKVTGGRMRLVVVTRESSRKPDEPGSVDCIGGKCAVDRLVIAGVLRGDSAKWLVRHARWLPAKPGAGKLTVDVFEIGGVR